MSMSIKKCCVPGCLESGESHGTLHLFPNPAKFKERFNQWVYAIGGDILGLDNNYIFKHRSVCHAHFEEKFCCRYNKLSNIAVPTLNLPGPLALPKFTFGERRPLRQIENIGTSSTATSSTTIPTPSIFAPTTFSIAEAPMVAEIVTESSSIELKNSEVDIASLSIATTSATPAIPSTSFSIPEAPMVAEIVTESSSIELKNSEVDIASLSIATTSATPAIPSTSFSIPEAPMVSDIVTKSSSIELKNSEVDIATPTVATTSATPAIRSTSFSISECIKSKTYITKIAKKSKVRTSPEEKRLYEKLIQSRIKLSKCRNNLKKLSAHLKAAKNIVTNPALLATLEAFPSAAKVFTMMQFREMKKKTKGYRFTLQEKILALSIYKQAPKGYRFLRKMFVLPAHQTLAKLISQANIEPGINKKMFVQLEKVAEKMKSEEKLCVLLFDEMFLKANITYNERKDRAIGLVTDGETTKPEFADHAQVYMIRGLTKNYKQAVAYSFSKAATSGPQIVKQIKEIVRELKRIGMTVVATVCDQGANNRLALKMMTQETRGAFLKKGEEPKDNIILIDDQEVVPFYDPPHLIKCIRNNLLTKNLQYVTDGKKCTAKWEHLVKLYEENPGYKGVRLIPKLTDNHVIPEKVGRNKMRVKYATQIFSRTVASNMGYLADKGIIPKECKETADMLLFFDNLFDSFNGSHYKKKEKFSKPLLGPVTAKSEHYKFWEECKEKLKSMKFVSPITGKTENVPTLINWAWSIDSAQTLIKKLEKEHNVTSVWMRHLNQDPIENFFGLIRSHGCRSTNPTPEKFEGAFTSLLINNMSSVHAPRGTNCEQDLCETLHALVIANDCKAAATCELDYLPEITITDINIKNRDPRIRAPLYYITGYFAKKSKTNVFKGCKTCIDNVISSEPDEYMNYREYAGRHWLITPTVPIIQCISAIQDITNTIIKECIEKKNIKEFIKTNIIMFVEFDFLNCQVHKDDLINYLINLTSRFFLFNYCKEINKILSGQIDCYDDEDKLQVKAKKYYKKCRKRPIK